MRNYKEEDSYFRAKKKVEKIKGFYTHAIVYVVINIMLLILIYSSYTHKSNFWNLGTFSTAIGWGVGLLIHGISVFGKQIVFSESWEQKKIKQFLEEEQQGAKWE